MKVPRHDMCTYVYLLLFEGTPAGIEVVVEILLSLMAQNKHLLRKVVNCIFKVISEQMTEPALLSILDVLSSGDENKGDDDSDDDDDDDENEDDEDESEIEESDEEKEVCFHGMEIINKIYYKNVKYMNKLQFYRRRGEFSQMLNLNL